MYPFKVLSCLLHIIIFYFMTRLFELWPLHVIRKKMCVWVVGGGAHAFMFILQLLPGLVKFTFCLRVDCWPSNKCLLCGTNIFKWSYKLLKHFSSFLFLILQQMKKKIQISCMSQSMHFNKTDSPNYQMNQLSTGTKEMYT